MADPLTEEVIYLRLGSLIADMPDFKAGPTPETRHWVARVLALIEVGNLVGPANIFLFKVRHRNWMASCATRT